MNRTTPLLFLVGATAIGANLDRDVIQAERLVVLNQNGKPAVILGTNQFGAGELVIYDAIGTETFAVRDGKVTSRTLERWVIKQIKSTTTSQPSPRPADVPPPAITGRGQKMPYEQPAVYGEDPILAIYLVGKIRRPGDDCQMLFQITNISGKQVQAASLRLSGADPIHYQVWHIDNLGPGASVWFLRIEKCNVPPTFTLTSLK